MTYTWEFIYEGIEHCQFYQGHGHVFEPNNFKACIHIAINAYNNQTYLDLVNELELEFIGQPDFTWNDNVTHTEAHYLREQWKVIDIRGLIKEELPLNYPHVLVQDVENISDDENEIYHYAYIHVYEDD